MTKDEHNARAMLLGGRYLPTFGYYLLSALKRVDAQTLERMTTDDIKMRHTVARYNQDWYPE